jgi:hypothetical protein
MVEIFDLYKNLNLVLSSCSLDVSIEKDKVKKHLNFYGYTNWKEKPKLNKNASCQLLLCGKSSNITAIDFDDIENPLYKDLLFLCDKQCNFIQKTRKGYHYIFKYTDKLKTSVGTNILIDIRNDNSVLIVEPTQYEIDGKIHKYYFVKKPNIKEEINEITNEIIEKFIELKGFKPNKEINEKIKEITKISNKDLKNCNLNNKIEEEEIIFILDNIKNDRFDNFNEWITLGIILKKYNIKVDIYEKYSKKSNKYIENEPFNVYQSINIKNYEDIKINTLYYWLKIDNIEKFNEIINKHKEEYKKLKTEKGDEEYQKIKNEVEKKYFLVGSKFYKKLDNREGFDILREADIKIELKPKQIENYNEERNKTTKIDFYSKWIIDENRLFFDRTDFIPNFKDCPENIFNLFDGFEAEKYLHLIENFDEEQIKKKIKPFLKHIKYLTNGDSHYFISWLSHIIQKPNIKEGTTPLFRDKGQFLQSGGGTGKNLFFDNFGNKILGPKYYLTIGTNNELYNSFNEHLENKLLITIEEAQGKANFENFDRLKSIITQSKTIINRKGIPKYTINDYSRYIFCSNNENPIPIDNNDRRFFIYDVNSEKRGDVDYFKKLDNIFNDKEAIACLFQYLKNYETYDTPIDYQINRPINKAYVEIKRINAPLIIKWLISMIKKNEKTKIIKYENIKMSELYADFYEWIEESRNKKTELSLNNFSRFLTSDSEIFTSSEINKTKSSTIRIKLKLDLIKNKLKEKNYIDENLNDCPFID